MADRNWKCISEAPKGAGPLLLRAGSGPSDPAYVGYQGDDGRWMFGNEEVHPRFFCMVPQFDAEDPQ